MQFLALEPTTVVNHLLSTWHLQPVTIVQVRPVTTVHMHAGIWKHFNLTCIIMHRALGAGEDLKSFDVDTKWGKQALDRLYSDVLGHTDQMPGVHVSKLLCRDAHTQ